MDTNTTAMLKNNDYLVELADAYGALLDLAAEMSGDDLNIINNIDTNDILAHLIQLHTAAAREVVEKRMIAKNSGDDWPFPQD